MLWFFVFASFISIFMLFLPGCTEGQQPFKPQVTISSTNRAPEPETCSTAAPVCTKAEQPLVLNVDIEPSLALHSPLMDEEPFVVPEQEMEKPASLAAKTRYRAGEDPHFAKEKGWPVIYPAPLSGAILPDKRIVAYYGNPLSKRMGVLGEYSVPQMLQKLQKEVQNWQQADPELPVQPALHLIAVVAQGEPGKSGKYRMIMPDQLVEQVYGWAKEVGAILFIDLQTGHDDLRSLLPRFEWILQNPDVHLGIDPEFNLIASMKKPGSKIGTFDASDINYAANYLKELVIRHNLPPKVLVVHRFTQGGVTNARQIVLCPQVQIVMHMDGWGAPWLKRDTYRDYIVKEPVQFTGFKLFYHNDTKKGDPLMTPHDLLKLRPQPVYIQYQ